jgi:hypothetical protein
MEAPQATRPHAFEPELLATAPRQVETPPNVGWVRRLLGNLTGALLLPALHLSLRPDAGRGDGPVWGVILWEWGIAAGALWAAYELWVRHVRSLLARATPVVGVVTEREEGEASVHLTVRHPEEDGTARTLIVSLARGTRGVPALSPGATLTLLADPRRPERRPAPFLPLREQWRQGAPIHWPAPPEPEEA